MAGTITVSGKFAGYTHSLSVDVIAQDSVDNTTTVSYSYNVHREVAKAQGQTITDNSVAFHAILDGVDNTDSPNFNFKLITDFEVLSGEQTLDNNEDGTLSFTVQLSSPGKTGSPYMHAASKSATFTVDKVDRSSSLVVSPQPATPGSTFTVTISRLETDFTHSVYMTDSSDVTTTVATGVATSTTGTVPALPGGATSDTASIQVDTYLGATLVGSQSTDLLIWSAPDSPPVNLQTPFDFHFRNMIRVGSALVANEVIPFTEASFTDTYSDTSACQITTQDALYSANLDKAVVLVEVYNGSAWVNTGLIFTLTRVESNSADPEGVAKYSGTAYLDFLLGKGLLGSDAKHVSNNPGQLIKGHLDGVKTHSWGPLVSYGFTTSKSSAGSKWTFTSITQDLTAGTPLLQVVQSLVQDNEAEYRCEYNPTTGKAVLGLYNPGYGYDWTVSTSKTIINLKTQGVTRVVTEAPVQKDYSEMLTRVTATGKTTNKKIKVKNPKTGLLNTKTRSSTLTRTKVRNDLVNPLYGVLEGRVDASGVGSATKLLQIADDVIKVSNEPTSSRQFTYQVDSQEISPALYPYRVFKPGDWVLVPGDDGVPERDRIAQLVVARTNDGITVQITTGDLIPSGPLAMYRKLHRSTAGAIPGGIMTTTPANAGTVVPSAVGNLAATTAGTFDTTGIARSAIVVTWDEVTTDSDGNDLQVPTYQILTRADYTEAWNVTAESDSTNTILDKLPPSTSVDVAVIAVADDGSSTDPDDYITVVTSDPDAMVGQPDEPTLEADAIGNVSITWNGLMEGVAPTLEFSYVRPEISADGTTGWSPAGSQLSSAGSTVVQNVGAGTWYFSLVPVDTLGRDGDRSDVASVVVDPVLADLREPKAPTGLAVTSSGQWSGSEPTASVTATWTAVTEATDNSAMDIIAYELWGKLHTDTNYAFVTSAAGTATTVTYNGIIPLGSSWDFELRATGANVVQSAFSTPVTTTIAVPSLTLDPPTAPDITSFRGLLIVSWDGNLVDSSDNAYTAPAYLANVDIWVSVDAGTTYTRMGFLQAGTRTQSVAGLGVGTEVDVTLIAVDRVGNFTAPSDAATTTIIGLDGADMIVNTLDANAIIAGTLNVDKVSPSFGNELDLSANDAVTILAGTIDDVQVNADGTAASLAAMQTRYSFTPSAAIISQPGSAFSVSISNTDLEFLEAGIARAYLNAGVFYAPKLSSNEITLTSHFIGDDPAGAGTIIKRY